jgi:hypothetical protein
MCFSEDKLRSDSAVTDNTTASSEHGSDWSDSSPLALKSKKGAFIDSSIESSFSFSGLMQNCLAGAIGAAGMVSFSLWLPFYLAPHAAKETYDWAFYSYDENLSHFDNSIWTYGTDYILAVIMGVLGLTIMRHTLPNVSDKLCLRAAALPLTYCVSVAAGGLAHQFYTTLESRNTMSFRVLWTICVGTVTAASTFMGMSGSEVLRNYQAHPACSPSLRKIPVVPDSFWITFGVLATAVCAWGGISFQRPACDIFLAGITQTPSSFYIMVFFYLVKHDKVQSWSKWVGFVGFIFNAPLLPMYPLLVVYTDWSLASVNTLLHCWLCVAWSMQAISLRHMARGLVLQYKDTVTTSHKVNVGAEPKKNL